MKNAATIISYLLLALLAPREARISEDENRMLAGFPQLTEESLLSGDFFAGIEDYLSDGFFARADVVDFADGIFISEKMGIHKPDKRFVNLALDRLGVTNREKVLVIGDSLSADVKCGLDAGLDTCWCNFKNQENTTNLKPTYTVQGFEELKRIILTPEELEKDGTEKAHKDKA